MIMMKKTSLFVLRATALASMAVALSAHALQTVTPVKDAGGTAFTAVVTAGNVTSWSTTAGLGTTVTVIGRYSDGSSGNEAGLGLKVKYDETKFTGVTVTALNTKCMIAPPQVQPAGATSQAVMGWIETSKRAGGAVGWPALADLASPDGCLSPNTPANETGAASPTLNLFQFTGTLAPSVGLGGTADILITADGNFSYAGAGPGMNDQKITVTAAAAPSITMSGGASRATHTGGALVGVRDIAVISAFGGGATLAATAADTTITTEPRRGGGALFDQFSAVMTFNVPPTSGTASIVSCLTWNGTAGVPCATNPTLGAVVFDNATSSAIISLSGVVDQSRVQLRLTNVNGSGIDGNLTLGFLIGDVQNDRATNTGDINQVKAQSGTLTPTARFDINKDGAINTGDINAVKAASGRRLP
jgi:hypothetical protein